MNARRSSIPQPFMSSHSVAVNIPCRPELRHAEGAYVWYLTAELENKDTL